MNHWRKQILQTKVADIAKVPPRKLTPDLKSLEKLGLDLNPRFSNTKIWPLIIVNYMSWGFFAVLMFFVEETLAAIIFIALALLVHFIVDFLQRRRMRQIRFLLVNGHAKLSTVLSNKINWGSQMNNAPQRVIELTVDGHKKTFNTYDHDLADEFNGETVVLYHPESKWILPINYFIKYRID